ncbi:apolipoprotein N-acyltransferase [Mesorhizobium sp. NBSH29]|uniref:apolipoprotein N-acyltransferase n=1 Tax=Mesorhizobium sp. NBSH29 TaxID=2654249 RepID=UPI0018965638|nr:apolipoprotein N-acyltransferase [Mesorhizobium sp. NBSH29]QPC86513.1 apolipoprotein N-acyltransferase [Mesorhizobium sp. NBSH29]
MKRLAGRIILLWGWRRALVAFLAGALAVLGQAPYDFFAIGFVSFPILVWLLDGATVEPPTSFIKRAMPAFAIGWWFGFGYFVTGLWWVGSAMLVEAEAFAWALPLAVLALPAGLAIFFGLATSIARLFWSGNIGRIAALAFGFGLAEWLRATVLTGFPWNPVGYAAMPIPLLMQSVSVIGVTGMNALAVFVFAMPALLASNRTLKTGIAVALGLMILHVGFGVWSLTREAAAPESMLAVRIVQPSTAQNEKWDQNVRDRIFRTMLELSAQPTGEGIDKPQLIVWPETSVPFLFTDRPDALVAIGELLSPGQTLMAGAVRVEGAAGAGGEPRFYNSVVVINDAGEITDAVDKVHLVPFGEYLPFEDALARVGIKKIVQFPMTFSAGTERHPVTIANGVRALAFICYEIIFPNLAPRANNVADVIINVTNDAWFGNTPGPYQHFRQAQIRAVETGMPVVRAANTGISGYIDGKGRIIDALSINAAGVVDAIVAFTNAPGESILFRGHAGLLILVVLALLAGGMALRERLRVN